MTAGEAGARRADAAGFVTLAAALWPRVSSADVIWPALIVTTRLLSVPAIAIGLVVEIACLRLALELPWRRSLVAGVTMNAASCVLGAFLVPLAGVVWEVFPGLVLYRFFNIGTFNPGTWTATFVLAVLVNALVEAIVLRAAFGIAFRRRVFAVLSLANCASVAVAYLSLWWRAPEY